MARVRYPQAGAGGSYNSPTGTLSDDNCAWLARRYAEHSGVIETRVLEERRTPLRVVLPDSQLWADSDARADGAVRRFSATFLADLLADLGVDVAVCLHASAYDRAAFLARGIEAQDLATDPGATRGLAEEGRARGRKWSL